MRTVLALLLLCTSAAAQQLPSRWDELTASDWPRAQERAAYTCILPIGILEKHGPHLPMGSDLIHVRELAARAAREEYAVVFPDFYFGQIYEAQHTPGTFALPSRVVWDLLDATVEEIARNGFKKIVIVNGHGGNPDLLRFFVQSQLERRRDYVVYFFTPEWDEESERRQRALHKSDPATDLHAGENESSAMLYVRPDLVQLERATQESGEDQKRLPALPNLHTAIWWYARFPNHYAGEGAKATRELGQALTEHRVAALVEALRAVKADDRTPQLQKEFFDRINRK